MTERAKKYTPAHGMGLPLVRGEDDFNFAVYRVEVMVSREGDEDDLETLARGLHALGDAVAKEPDTRALIGIYITEQIDQPGYVLRLVFEDCDERKDGVRE